MLRLQKFIAQAGICSRRKAEELIKAGKIKVNDKIITKLGTSVDENTDVVEYQNKIVELNQDKIYLALNKPIGYISSTDGKQGKTVTDLVRTKKRIYPVGRLDKDSSGLLILTNDGDFANKLTHPKFGSEKEYFAVLDQDLKKEDIKRMERGMRLGGKRLQPVKVVSAQNKSARLILKEGMNRQIRRMFGRMGYTVVKLKRIRIGKLELGELKPGQYKEIKKYDVK